VACFGTRSENQIKVETIAKTKRDFNYAVPISILRCKILRKVWAAYDVPFIFGISLNSYKMLSKKEDMKLVKYFL
jgi:hypothetical protein